MLEAPTPLTSVNPMRYTIHTHNKKKSQYTYTNKYIGKMFKTFH